jgi:GTP-binding protein
MFIDKTELRIKAGNGGDGMIAFHREKFIEKGGPSGGDGGRGGNIYFIADSGVNTLLDLKYRRKVVAADGAKGMGKNAYGKSAPDIEVKVPLGTIVINKADNKLIADINELNKPYLIAKGGRGGRGNSHFKSSINRVPRIAENGEPGQEIEVVVELKLLADVGLVGFPSVGKSTLLSAISSAKPEIGDYHFTTLSPNLGVVKLNDMTSFVVADLPGLIEGASQGKGLGLSFLKHIERCRVLIHVIDISSAEGRDPFQDFKIVNNELKSYRIGLMKRPMIIAANKIDDPGSELLLEDFIKKIPKKYKVFPISALTKRGLKELIIETHKVLTKTALFPLFDDIKGENIKTYKFKGEDLGFKITKFNDKTWLISGERIEKLYRMTNLSDDQGFIYLTATMRKMGIEEELNRLGAKEGDNVRLLDFEFTFFK